MTLGLVWCVVVLQIQLIFLWKVGFVAKIVVGNARIIREALPNATYIGFTGTPVSTKDRNTREIFGEYIDVYDMTQAVEDGATRPVYYESRVVHLKLDENNICTTCGNLTGADVVDNSVAIKGIIQSIFFIVTCSYSVTLKNSSKPWL